MPNSIDMFKKYLTRGNTNLMLYFQVLILVGIIKIATIK